MSKLLSYLAKNPIDNTKLLGLRKPVFVLSVTKQRKRKNTKKPTKLQKVEAEKEGLPELKGSEKQVAWAMTLRQRMFDDIAKLIEKTPVQSQKMARDFKTWAVSQAESRFWIDHRDMTVNSLVREWFSSLSTAEKAVYKK